MNPRRQRPRVRWRAVVLAALVVCGLGFAAVSGGLFSVLDRTLYPVRYAAEIEESCGRHGVDPLLACAVISCESGWDDTAVSHAGAIGLMQVMPDTARSVAALGVVDENDYDPADLADPVVNIEYGCAYLGYLQDHLSSEEEVIAAYNAGIGAVQGWIADGGSIPEDVEYAETRTYLERVTSAYEAYRRNYPNGITA